MQEGKRDGIAKEAVAIDGHQSCYFYYIYHIHAFKMRSTAKFFCLFFALAAIAHAAVKPYPRGIMDLPGAISAKEPIGTLADHPWENPNVDGLRIRTGWDNTENSG